VNIKAIETVYNGYRFRSRLEARWAVFFDTLGVKYEYEKEGFELGDGLRYLPDFWLPKNRIWVEIKGTFPAESEMRKASLLAEKTKRMVFIFGEITLPGVEEYPPEPVGFYADGRHMERARLMSWAECPVCGVIDIGRNAYCGCLEQIKEEINGLAKKLGDGGWEWQWFNKVIHTMTYERMETPRLIEAYTAARQARFEFGQKG
jgi:hypothetical protein